MADSNPGTVTTKKTTQKAKAPKTVEATYSITTKQEGFRRAGRSWSGTTKVAADELTSEQIDQLKADPMFVVVDL